MTTNCSRRRPTRARRAALAVARMIVRADELLRAVAEVRRLTADGTVPAFGIAGEGEDARSMVAVNDNMNGVEWACRAALAMWTSETLWGSADRAREALAGQTPAS